MYYLIFHISKLVDFLSKIKSFSVIISALMITLLSLTQGFSLGRSKSLQKGQLTLGLEEERGGRGGRGEGVFP